MVENNSASPVRGAVWLGMGVMLFVIGARLGLIHCYGTDQPFADQWAAEGVGFLQAPLHEQLNWASFFWPHGEHRPAVTRLITRGLITANDGQWDCYVEIVFNLLINAAFILVAWRIALQITRGFWIGITALFMALLFAQPCAYENLLWGFQSQFLFLLFCGLFHVFGTLRSSRVDFLWWCAQLVGFCGLFSIAAGVASPAALLALALFELLRGRRDPWAWFTLSFNGALLAYGLWLLPAGVVSSGNPFDHLIRAFLHTSYLLSWPLGGAWWCLLLQAPCLGALIIWLRGGKTTLPRARLVAVIGIWLALIAFTVGYGRSLTPETIGIRYYDVLILSVFSNALGLVLILSRAKDQRIQWVTVVLAVVWLGGVGVGFWHLNRPAYSGAMLRQQKTYALEQRQIIREFLVSDNPSALEEFSNRTHRMPHFQLTLALLRDKEVQPLLPPTLSTDGRTGPLSRLAPQVSALWWLLISAGGLMLAAGGLGRCLFPKSRDG